MPEAFLILATATIELVKEMVKSQPPEVQKQLWEWYVEDMKRWRRILHIEEQ